MQEAAATSRAGEQKEGVRRSPRAGTQTSEEGVPPPTDTSAAQGSGSGVGRDKSASEWGTKRQENGTSCPFWDGGAASVVLMLTGTKSKQEGECGIS